MNTIQTYLKSLHFDRKYVTSYWTFPVVVLVVIVALSFAGISGSSIGTYDGLLNNDIPKIGPIPTRPRGVRSDEWLVNTQLIVAQYKDGFPVINHSIGTGQDMSIVVDVPYKDWSILFKPQYLIFFVAPLNFAFAFKWWLLAGMLVMSAYALFLKVLPRQRVAAVLFSSSLFFAPMVQWWYQTITIVPLAMGLFILTLLLSIHETKSRRKKLLFGALLSYCVTAFALVLYPPFQIPILLVVAACYAAYCLQTWRSQKHVSKQLIQDIGLVGLSGLVALAIVGLFLLQHTAAIHAISSSSYPGHRDIPPGDYSLFHVVGNYLAPFWQSGNSVMHYTELKGGANQSEISSFLYPVVPLMLLGGYLWFRKQAKHAIMVRSLLGGSLCVLILFMARLTLPYGQPVYKLLGLNLVPQNRLLIGLGFACIPLIIGIAASLQKQKMVVSKKILGLLCALAAIFYAVTTHEIMVRNPGYVSYPVIAVCAIIATIGFLLLLVLGRLRLALAVLLGLSIVSTILANPLDRNLNEITDTQLAQTIQSLNAKDPSARWVAEGGVVLENYALANGAKSLSATYTYPQLSLWRPLDPGLHNKDVYNRYAHVEFTFDDTQATPALTLVSPDAFNVKLSSCDTFLKKYNVQYIYGTKSISSGCFTKLKSFTYRDGNIYVYKRL